MFVRKKRNASGSVSVQIIDKTKGYKVVQTVGSATHPDEIARLRLQGQQIVHAAQPGLTLPPPDSCIAGLRG
ncbi:MAG: hypothetical protein V1926_00890 [Candidatus Peregrinibacteria bacterium]